MAKPLIRNRRLVTNPLGDGYDLSRLTAKEMNAANDALQRHQAGRQMRVVDAEAILEARKAAHAPGTSADPMDKLNEAVRRFSSAVRGV